tara:strand:+ start:141 stop:542 length:402 start_codon:yes stop_codon:yes gene_type:complete
VSYKVGQIVYLLSRKDVRIFPAQVVEEIRRKTIDHELISYILRLPNKDLSEVLLDEIDAEVFTSLRAVEEAMKKNAYDQIKEFLKKAQSLESVLSPKKITQEENEVELPNKKVAEIDLGNGVKGKINLNEIPI